MVISEVIFDNHTPDTWIVSERYVVMLTCGGEKLV